jgi:hypothetical protein
MNIRKSFVFSGEATARLEQLGKVCRMTSASNVVRLALMVLEDLVSALAQGKRIELISADGSREPYHPLVEREGVRDASCQVAL